jgi:hypothetical protein
MDPTFLLADGSGWLIAALAAVTITLPYLARRRAAAGIRAAGGRLLDRLEPHYWIGFTLAGVSVLHAALATSSLPTPGGAGWAIGIWVALGAMLLVFGQVSLGLQLRRPIAGPERRRTRRLHLLTMTVLVAAGVAHIVLNGAVARDLLGIRL